MWIYHILSKHHTPFKPQQSLKFTLQIYSQIHSNIISRILTAELFVTYKTQKWPRCVLIKWLNALWMKGQNIQLKNLEGPEWSVPTASCYHPPSLCLSVSLNNSCPSSTSGPLHILLCTMLLACASPPSPRWLRITLKTPLWVTS